MGGRLLGSCSGVAANAEAALDLGSGRGTRPAGTAAGTHPYGACAGYGYGLVVAGCWRGRSLETLGGFPESAI